jgi:hypothetical protein
MPPVSVELHLQEHQRVGEQIRSQAHEEEGVEGNQYEYEQIRKI